jgi:hypothetical protein
MPFIVKKYFYFFIHVIQVLKILLPQKEDLNAPISTGSSRMDRIVSTFDLSRQEIFWRLEILWNPGIDSQPV